MSKILLTGSLCLLLTSCGGGGGGGDKDVTSSTPNSSSSNSSKTSSSSSKMSSSSSSKTSSSSSSTAAVSCNNDKGSAISTRNNTSHRIGQNCLSCHTSGGSATAMTVAGTIFKPGGTTGNPNATVRLYAFNSNTLVATLVTDKCGNFYTTAKVEGLFVKGGPLVNGVNVVVENNDTGLIRTMPGLITNGGCNSCHGATNGKIIVN